MRTRIITGTGRAKTSILQMRTLRTHRRIGKYHIVHSGSDKIGFPELRSQVLPI